MRLAGLDVGTTRTRLIVFDDDLNATASWVVASPTRVGGQGLPIYHESRRLRELARSLAARAVDRARGLGLSTYRASVLAWGGDGEPLSDIVLWSNWVERIRAARGIPVWGRVARLLPVYKSILGPASPLPLMARLSRQHGREARVWTVEAFLAQSLGGGFYTDEGSAALSGLLNPRNMKPIPLARRLAGLPKWFQEPRVGPMTLEDGGLLKSLSPDQQAGLVGLSCLRLGCVAISLGTGGFALAVMDSPPRVPRGGVIPIVVYSDGSRRRLGVEAHSLGLGAAVERAVETLGGFRDLDALGSRECLDGWRGAFFIPREGGRGVFAPPPQSRVDALCGLIVSISLEAALLAWRLPLTPRMYWLTGGLSKCALARALLSTLLPTQGSLWHYGGEATARGAAVMAGVSLGLFNSPEDASPPEPVEVPRNCWDGVTAADDVSVWRTIRSGRGRELLGALHRSVGERLDCLTSSR